MAIVAETWTSSGRGRIGASVPSKSNANNADDDIRAVKAATPPGPRSDLGGAADERGNVAGPPVGGADDAACS